MSEVVAPDNATGTGTDGRRHKPHRVTALADGVFAIAMTLLALEIRVPEGIENEAGFQDALPGLLTAIAVFAAAFFITAQYWLGHHRVMSYVHTVDDRTLGLTIMTLFGVAALPVAANLITNWSRYPEAVAVAGALLALTSLLSVRLYAHVLTPGLADIEPAARRQILFSPFYNAVIYLVSIPLAYGLHALGANSALALLLWMLLPFNRALTGWLVRHT